MDFKTRYELGGNSLVGNVENEVEASRTGNNIYFGPRHERDEREKKLLHTSWTLFDSMFVYQMPEKILLAQSLEFEYTSRVRT